MVRAVIFDMFETLVTLFTGRTYFSENIREDLANVGVSLDEFRRAWHATEVGRSTGEYTMAEGLAKTLRLIGYGGEKDADGAADAPRAIYLYPGGRGRQRAANGHQRRAQRQ